MIKSLFCCCFFSFRNQWVSFKSISTLTENINALSLVASRLMLQSLVSEQWAWFTNREKRQRGRLIWSHRTGPVWEGNFQSGRRRVRKRRRRVRWRYSELTSVIRWSNLRRDRQPRGRVRRMLHDSDPVLLRGSRVDGEGVVVGGGGGGSETWGH